MVVVVVVVVERAPSASSFFPSLSPGAAIHLGRKGGKEEGASLRSRIGGGGATGESHSQGASFPTKNACIISSTKKFFLFRDTRKTSGEILALLASPSSHAWKTGKKVKSPNVCIPQIKYSQKAR